jgi:hypothetical protein
VLGALLGALGPILPGILIVVFIVAINRIFRATD